MAKAFEINIESLRKKSRELLLKIEKNSKIVDEEIKSLHSQIRLPAVEAENRCGNLRPTGPKDCWKIRNDSSGVSGLLCPGLFENQSQIYSSKIGDNCDDNNLKMTIKGGKILLTSKPQPISKSPLRRPIQGCYCNEPQKVLPRSARTFHKPLSTVCKHCQSNYELNHKYHEAENIFLTPALSCETLRRVQRINYTPRSEFLRKVQQKVSKNYDYCHSDENIESDKKNDLENQQNGRASSLKNKFINLKNQQEYRKYSKQSETVQEGVGSRTIQSSSDDDEIEEVSVAVDVHKPDDSPSEDEITRLQLNLEKTLKKPQKIPSKSTVTTKNSSNKNSHGKKITSQLSINQISRESSPEIETLFPPRENIKTQPKKTISSKTLKNNEINKKLENKPVRVLSQTSCGYDPCLVNEKKNKIKTLKKTKKCLNCCHNCHEKCLSKCIIPDKLDENALELRKFRDKNYFDTHGSKATLLSSESSGSLEHFELNERLFPEKVGRIHRDDLVVSMPLCATKQLKKIHYFPRHIVQQEKNDKFLISKNFNTKRKKRPNCPLIGHAIDLGVLKAQRPTNSLALKFQEGVF